MTWLQSPLVDSGSPLFGLVFGLLLGLLYGLASYGGYKLAVWVGDLYYTAAVFGGMLIRMTVFLAVIAVSITFFDVDEFSFVGAFFLTFVFVLVIEIAALHRIGVREHAALDSDHPPGEQAV
ncbi:MAG: hypothetical protein HKN13_04880 [Rhodothermales bacterium]|nr:hypothetical protein [Rhodothermales bacterium]